MGFLGRAFEHPIAIAMACQLRSQYLSGSMGSVRTELGRGLQWRPGRQRWAALGAAQGAMERMERMAPLAIQLGLDISRAF
jgi:hypothetical protein